MTPSTNYTTKMNNSNKRPSRYKRVKHFNGLLQNKISLYVIMPGRGPDRRPRRRRRKKAKRAGRTGPRFHKLFPKKMPVKLTYCDVFTLPNTSAGSAAYKLRLNSIFAPSQTGGGTSHQPRGHDQWATIYEKYCVVGAKVKVEPIYSSSGGGSGNTELTIKGFIDDDVSEGNYTPEQLIELGLLGQQCKLLTIGDGGAHNISGRRAKNLNFKFSTKKFFGIKKDQQIINAVGTGQGEATALQGVQNVGALFGANPTMPAYLKLSVAGPNHDGVNATIACRCTITYSVIVHSPKEVASS